MGEHAKDELSSLYGKKNATIKALNVYENGGDSEAITEALNSYTDTDSIHTTDVVEDAKEMMEKDSLAFRLWIYRVATAVLLIATGFTSWQAITMHEWLQLLDAVLWLSGAGVANMARKNVR